MIRTYDFLLVLITVGLLLGLGLVSIYGTTFTFLAAAQDREWTQTPLYATYLAQMNSFSAPILLGLVLILGLCIPRRLFERTTLWVVSATMLLLSGAAALALGARVGLAVLFGVAMVLQYVVVVMVLMQSPGLVFHREGLLVQLGSALLHLGLVVLLTDLLLIDNPALHLLIFWIAAAFITAGTALSFYAGEIRQLAGGRAPEGKKKARLPHIASEPS